MPAETKRRRTTGHDSLKWMSQWRVPALNFLVNRSAARLKTHCGERLIEKGRLLQSPCWACPE
jgi:hypothetical protein